MATELQSLNGLATFLNLYGYVGVALLLGLVAWYFYKRPYMPGFWVTGTFALTFLIIFGALDIVTRYFPTLIVARDPLFVGRVANVAQDMGVRLSAGDYLNTRPYLRRENDADDVAVAHHRFIFLRRHFDCLILAVTPGDSREPRFYVVPVPAGGEAKADAELYIRGPKWSAVWLQGEKPVGEPKPARELQPSEPIVCDPSPPPAKAAAARVESWFAFLGQAIAQGLDPKKPPSSQSLATLLQSDDPFVRRQARQDIGAMGLAAEPTLQQFLGSNNYRLQIGAVEAISAMKGDARKSLKGDTWKEVEALKASPDRSLRESAQRALAERG